jgi:hypothetical protein
MDIQANYSYINSVPSASLVNTGTGNQFYQTSFIDAVQALRDACQLYGDTGSDAALRELENAAAKVGAWGDLLGTSSDPNDKAMVTLFTCEKDPSGGFSMLRVLISESMQGSLTGNWEQANAEAQMFTLKTLDGSIDALINFLNNPR